MSDHLVMGSNPDQVKQDAKSFFRSLMCHEFFSVAYKSGICFTLFADLLPKGCTGGIDCTICTCGVCSINSNS